LITGGDVGGERWKVGKGMEAGEVFAARRVGG
jgi:hypothetical protein